MAQVHFGRDQSMETKGPENDRSGAWRWFARGTRGFRRIVFDDESLVELKAAAIVFAFAILGAFAWLVWEANEDRQVTRTLRQQFEISRFQDRQAVHKEFADGIPKNLAYLDKIARLTIQMDDSSISGSSRSSLGRDLRELDDVRNIERREWLSRCPHYTAVCEQVAARFPEPVRTTAAKIRLLFDELNDDVYGPAERAEVGRRVLAVLTCFDEKARTLNDRTALAGTPRGWIVRREDQSIVVTMQQPPVSEAAAAPVLRIDAELYDKLRRDLSEVLARDDAAALAAAQTDGEAAVEASRSAAAHDMLDAIYGAIDLLYVASLRGMNDVMDQRPF